MVARTGHGTSVDLRRFVARRGAHLGLRAFGWLLLGVVLLIALFPPYFMIITAFHPPSLSFATLAAYSLSRLRYPGRAALSSTVFFVYLFPATLLFIPIFIVLNSLH